MPELPAAGCCIREASKRWRGGCEELVLVVASCGSARRACPPPLAPLTVLCTGPIASALQLSAQNLGAMLQSTVGRLAADLARQALLHMLRLLAQLVRQLQAQLAALARQVHVQPAQQQQLEFEGAGPLDGAAGSSGSAGISPVRPAAHVLKDAAALLEPAAAAPAAAASAPPSGWTALVSEVTWGASRLHETLNDAAAGITEKVTALNVSAASSMGEALFHATSRSAELLDDLASRGISTSTSKVWNHATTQAVLSEEERLRQAVFQQVYAELSKGK